LDCKERGIIPLHAHLYYDDVPATKKESAGPLYIRFPNMKSRFNRNNYYLPSFCLGGKICIDEILPLALKEAANLCELGKK